MKRANLRRKWSTTITKAADQFSKAGWSWGSVSAIDSNGRTIWIVDAHRGDGKRFVVRADEKPTVFVELERITRELALSALLVMTPGGRVAAAS